MHNDLVEFVLRDLNNSSEDLKDYYSYNTKFDNLISDIIGASVDRGKFNVLYNIPGYPQLLLYVNASGEGYELYHTIEALTALRRHKCI